MYLDIHINGLLPEVHQRQVYVIVCEDEVILAGGAPVLPRHVELLLAGHHHPQVLATLSCAHHIYYLHTVIYIIISSCHRSHRLPPPNSNHLYLYSCACEGYMAPLHEPKHQPQQEAQEASSLPSCRPPPECQNWFCRHPPSL